MCRTKGSVIGAVLLVLVLTLSFGLACSSKPAETPTSPPATSPQLPDETTPVPPETEIPANYTTYKDESQLFSISYPSDWERTLSQISGLEQNAKQAISNLKAGTPLAGATMIFFAGRRTATGYDPNINISVEPLAEGISTHDEMVEAGVQGAKTAFPDYRELSRVQTTVDGRKATIVEWEGTLQGSSTELHCQEMFVLANKTGWAVTCIARSGDFADWKNDFDAIVRSLRVSTETK